MCLDRGFGEWGTRGWMVDLLSSLCFLSLSKLVVSGSEGLLASSLVELQENSDETSLRMPS